MTDAARYNLLNPEGQLVSVPAEKLEEAYRSGYRPETDEEYSSRKIQEERGDTTGQIETGLAGAARALSFGQADRILTGTGLVGRRTLRELQQANPGSDLAGSIVGTVAAGALGGNAIASGAESVGARALSGIAGKGLAGRVLAKAGAKGLGSAVEGALYGTGQLLSEDALGDHEINAEKVMAHVGIPALLGLGVGGVLGGGSVLAREGAAKVAEKVGTALEGSSVAEKAKNWLTDFAEENRFKVAFGQNKRAFVQLDRKGLMSKADDELRSLVSAGDSQETLAAKIAARREAVGGELKSFVNLLDEAVADQPLKQVSPRLVAKRIEEEVIPKIDRAAQANVLSDVEGYVARLKDEGAGGISFSDARSKRAAVQDMINYNVDPKPLAEARQSIARIWNDVIDEHAAPVLDELGFPDAKGAYRELRQRFGLLEEMHGHAQSRLLGNQANRFISPSDYGVGGAIGAGAMAAGAPYAAAQGLAGALVNRVARTRGPAVLANLADKAASLISVEKAISSTNGSVMKAIDGFLSKAPRVVSPTSINVLGEVAFGAEKTARRAAALNREQRIKRFDQRVAELRDIADNPTQAGERIGNATSGVTAVAPKIGGALQLKTAQAAQFLLSKAPRDPGSAATLNPFLRKWQPTDADLAKWERYVEAVSDPTSVLKDLQQGTVSREGVEALKAIYPKLYEEIGRQVMDRVTSMDKPLPYRDRLQLGILFGVPTDETLTPQFLRGMQEVLAAPPTPELQQGGAVKPTVGGLSKLSLSDQAKTATQRISER